MILSRISIRRPVFATVISLLLVVLGLAAMLQLPVREFPDIDPPVVSITTVYPGASAEVIDREVTEIIEEQVSGIEGIRNINSTSRDEVSAISIEFTLARNLDAAAADVRDRVSLALPNLPRDVEAPVVAKVSSDAFPVMWITLTSSGRSQLELTDYAERNLTDTLAVLPGVARVIVGGERRPAMRVWLDPAAMAARGVTVDDVESALRNQNVELPAGRIEGINREFTVRSATRMATPEEFRRLVLRADKGYQLTLGDVARVEIGPESTRSALLWNGQPSVGLGIVRQSKTNTLAVAAAVEKKVAQLKQELPRDIHMEVAYSEAVFVRGSIREVLTTLLIAAGLVVAVIFIFLRSPRTTFVPAITIPICLIGAFVALWALGYSINTLTLLALVLAIGLVVDDTIVVLENVYRRHEAGEPKLVAGARGADQVGFAVIATTLVLITVFVPLAFIPGNTGKLFTEFGIALAAAVGISGIVALTIGAMLSSQLVETGRSDNRAYRWFENGFDALARGYVRALTRTVGHPLLVLLVAVVVSAVAFFIFRALPRELAPLEDRGFIIVPVQAPEGATFKYTSDVVNRINGILQPQMGGNGPVSGVLAIVAPARQGPAPVNQAFVIVRLKPWDEREQKQQAVVAQLLPPLFMLPEARAFAINPPSLGQGGFAEPVQVAVGGLDYADAARYGAQLLQKVAGVPGLLNPRIDYNERSPQLRLQLDRERAADLGIDARQVGGALQAMFGGFEVTDFIQGSQLYKVMLEAERGAAASPDDVKDVWLRSRGGQLVPLSSVATLQETGTAAELVRVNRSPSVTLKATLAPGAPFGDVIGAIDRIARETLPPEARVTFLGEAQTYQEAQGSIALFFGLALLIVYLVLAAQFESFIHPLVIMVAVPLAFTGGLLALFLTGHTLSIYGQVGLILLIGLVAKNGILLVDFANQFRDAGGDDRSAAIEAGRVRLRPVLMTSVAAIFGAIPLALATGPGAEGRIAIGIAVIGGLTLSTLLTLFVVPTFYAAVARYTRPGGWLARRLREEESAEERRL
jgi:multidrug efflux pump